MATWLRISRKLADRLMKALGLESSHKWSDSEMNTKLQGIPTWLDEETGTEDDKLDALLERIYELEGSVKLAVPKETFDRNGKEQENTMGDTKKTTKKVTKKKAPPKKATKKAAKKTTAPKKTTKKAPPKKTTKKAAKKATKKAVERDAFGDKTSTNYHKINAAIPHKKALSYVAILAKIAIDKGKAYYHHFNKLIELGYVTKTVKGFMMTTKGSKLWKGK